MTGPCPGSRSIDTARWRVVLLSAALFLSSAEAAGATRLGFTDDGPRVERAAPAVQGTSEVARIPVLWTGIAASGWDWLDGAVSAARASGQRVMLTVYGLEAPEIDRWQSFLRELAARYPDLWAVQAWNESNLETVGGGLSVPQTVAIVKAARRVLPGVRLVGPGVSPTVPRAARYQARLYRSLPDTIGMAINVYPYRDERLTGDILAQYAKAKADGGKAKIYVTEFGCHAAHFPNQAAAAAKGFRVLRREGAAAVIFYRLLTDPEAISDWELTGRFNVLEDDLSPTPILRALRKVPATASGSRASLP